MNPQLMTNETLFLPHKERLESWKTNFSPEFGPRLDIASEVELEAD